MFKKQFSITEQCFGQDGTEWMRVYHHHFDKADPLQEFRNTTKAAYAPIST